MSMAETYVRARIDADTKDRATEALQAMGLSISDAIRLLMLRVADERRLPFEIKAPNAATRKAMKELESGKGKKFSSVDALLVDLEQGMADLEADRVASMDMAAIKAEGRARRSHSKLADRALKKAGQALDDTLHAHSVDVEDVVAEFKAARKQASSKGVGSRVTHASMYQK